jgi:decaprenylphospho-beta-D-erythro-pentofuranosid-2-ulose 2-reductase
MSIHVSKAIVIGASSGIGEAIAKQLAQNGTQVAIIARRSSELERVAALVPNQMRCYPHDVTKVEEVPALFARIVEDLGGLDTIIYAAGVMPPLEEGEYHFDKDHSMMQVNVVGAMAWINPAVARFEAARCGNIVGISSIAGERGRRGNPAYCTSKAALSTYLEALRNRCSRYGVNVVTIKPGFVDTPMTRGVKNLFWLISAQEAAKQTIRLVQKGNSASAFVPARWAAVAFAVRSIPSLLFRRLNF